MKRSTKLITIITTFFLIIAVVVIARTMIGAHFQKKFSKRPPPGIIVTEVQNSNFSEEIESFGTAISKKTMSYRIKKNELISELELKEYVKKGQTIVKLKERVITAPFGGMLGYRGLTEDTLDSENSIIITLDDNSIIYSDLKIPEIFANILKKTFLSKQNFQETKKKFI